MSGKAEDKAEVKSAMELLEEDDEFEEFEGTSWEDYAGQAEADAQLWQDDWEDDNNVKDDFIDQLREQIENNKKNSK